MQEGRKAMGLDIKYDPSMDITTTQGLISTLHAATRLRPGSAALAAPVCSTWVYMPL